jgi:hypothetical protein
VEEEGWGSHGPKTGQSAIEEEEEIILNDHRITHYRPTSSLIARVTYLSRFGFQLLLHAQNLNKPQ